MSEEQQEQQQQKRYPVKQSAQFAGSALALSVLADLAGHLGPTGLLVSGMIGLVAWRHGPELAELIDQQVREHLPPPDPTDTEDEEREEPRHPGRTWWERALGLRAEEMLMDNDEGGPGEPGDPDPDLGESYGDDGLLYLGAGLRPHADTIFSNRLVILGMPGAGKSNLVAVLSEELGQFDAPLILFDRKPEYDPLCEEPFFVRPYRAGARNLSPENAYAFGQRVMRERLQVVVDLASYRNDVTAALVMLTLVESVGRWQEALSNEQRLPCTFVLDEAHYWLPENEALSTIRGVKSRKTGEPLLARLQQTFFTLATQGRSFGMGLIVSTQRPANVDKRLISVAEWRFLLKAMEAGDLKVYKTYGLSEQAAMSLDPKQGEAFVIGPQVKGVYHIRRRYSPDEAKTPGLSNIRNATTSSRQEQTAQHYSPFPHSPGEGGVEQYSPTGNVSPVKGEYGVNGPVKPVNGEVKGGEYSPGPVNSSPAFTEAFTPAEEVQVVLAYAELAKAGKAVTRTGIRDYLGWNNKQYERVIKPVCDKHHIAE